jgi:hypothetical protein
MALNALILIGSVVALALGLFSIAWGMLLKNNDPIEVRFFNQPTTLGLATVVISLGTIGLQIHAFFTH